MDSINAAFDVSSSAKKLMIRQPSSLDGMALNKLVKQCPPLDPNSAYCNLLQCHHFSDTAATAFDGDRLVGFVSGYLLPSSPSTFFVWQIAVHSSARGCGLAGRMLRDILSRAALSSVTHIQTTISPGNEASQAVFRKLADQLNTAISSDMLFSREDHFAGEHDDELLFTVGPFSARSAAT